VLIINSRTVCSYSSHGINAYLWMIFKTSFHVTFSLNPLHDMMIQPFLLLWQHLHAAVSS
jgi:hypothetical protein